MALTAEALCEEIRRAFHDVKLGGGIGLSEADAVDDYADDATRAACRQRDEREDWQRIPLENLRGEGLCFTDAEGMRFHLPAFMIAAAEHGSACSPVFMLKNERAQGLFVLLSSEQIHAVRDYLLFAKDDPKHQLDRADIEQALAGPWRHEDERPKS
jgi:hypothetical protein